MYVFVDFYGMFFIYRSPHGEKAKKLPERTNEVTGIYANGCVEVATEFCVSSVNLWSKMQETQGW
ncbi:putative SGNH hydrolase superfamily [Helianthus debilis subsp. tardiflorus]